MKQMFGLMALALWMLWGCNSAPTAKETPKTETTVQDEISATDSTLLKLEEAKKEIDKSADELEKALKDL